MRFFLYFILFYFCFFGLADFKVDDSLNRRIYAFNRGFDKSFLNPCLTVYVKVFPSFLDKSFENFFRNISEINNLFYLFFKLDVAKIQNTFYRFFLNFYFGFLGFLDISFFYDYYYSNFDFQMYMFFNGFKDFVYMIAPVIGPSTMYFNIGLFIFHFINPIFYFFDDAFFYYFFEILNKKSVVMLDVNFFHNVMLDGYIFLKDIYIQNLESLFDINFDNFLIEPPD